MSKSTTKTLVPNLRFPEFRDAGEWEQKTLRELAKRITQKNKETEITRVLTNSAVDGIVDQRDYFDKDIANQNNLGGYFIVNKGDYVYNPRISNVAPVGPISKNKVGKGVMSPLYTVFRFKNSNNGFYEQYFKSTHWYQYLRIVSNSGARHDRMSITNDDFEEMPLPALSADEQQKIADCLSSIDDLITAHSQKHDALKAHKKGLMQQLFPTEGETVPNLRFPEFRDAGEWEEQKLGNVISYFKGFAFKSKDYVSSGRRIVRVSDMGFDYIKEEDKATYISEKKAIKYEKWELQKNDLIVTTVGSKPPVYDSLVGRTIVVKSKDERSLLNQNAVCLRANKNIEQCFFNTLFKRNEYITFVESIIRGNANQGSITLENLFQFQLLIPSPKEQQEIADCLSSIDELITAQAQKIESLKAHKKSLMQQLFPSTDEVCS